MSVADLFLFGLMLTTAGALIWGLCIMVRGNPDKARLSNKLMMWRVMLQGSALALLVILFAVGGGEK